jgi:hypothetical protein
MFPGEDFLMGQIGKIQKNKKGRVEERKRGHLYNIAWSRQDQQMQSCT